MAPIKKAKNPTKSSEAILLEKKNKEEAESIVDELKRISGQTKRSVDVTDNPSTSDLVNPSTKPGEPILKASRSEATKKRINASKVLKKNKAEAKAIVSKVKCIPRQPTRLIDPNVVLKSDVASKANVFSKADAVTKTNVVLKDDMISKADVVSKADVRAEADVGLKNVNNSGIIDLTASTSTGNSAAVTSTAKKNFSYEINCEGVSQSVNVVDLQQFIQGQLKVDGKKDNCGDTVAIRCRDFVVGIESKTYLPKRYLRFLCKKFLKRYPNIRVVSNGTKSYELNYCGAS